VNPHTAPRTSGKRIDESPRHRAGIDEIHLEQHRFARGRDRLQHPAEDPVAVGEQLESIALPHRPTHGGGCSRRKGPHRQADGAFSARHGTLFYARPLPCAAPDPPAAAVQNRSRRFCALEAAVILLLPWLLGLWPPLARANAIGAVNRARITYCGLSRTFHRPLAESRALDEVARLIARGDSLEEAERRAGYRAASSLWIEIAGATDDAAVERMVSRRFCGQLAQPQLRSIGAYGGDGRLWLVFAQPLVMPAARDAAAVSRLVLTLTNEARAHGRTCGWHHFAPAPPLSLSMALTLAARAHSRDMAAHDLFSHAGSDGSSPGQRVTRAGYRWSMVGENIASGAGTPRQVVAGWLASPHHCANIMTAGFRQMGVAFAVNPASGEVIYWTEDFGTPR
jgi:uncharacterized protein YkwD